MLGGGDMSAVLRDVSSTIQPIALPVAQWRIPFDLEAFQMIV
jgi:hypothetical protein